MPKPIKKFIIRKNSTAQWVEIVPDSGIEFKIKRALRNDVIKLSIEVESKGVKLDDYIREWALEDWKPKEALIDEEGNEPTKADIFNDPLFGNALDSYIFGQWHEVQKQVEDELKN